MDMDGCDIDIEMYRCPYRAHFQRSTNVTLCMSLAAWAHVLDLSANVLENRVKKLSDRLLGIFLL